MGERLPRSSGAGGAARHRGRPRREAAPLRGQRQHGGADRGEPGGARHAGAAPAGAAAGHGKLATYLGFLVELVEASRHHDAGLARALEAEHGVKVDPSSISRALIRAGMTYKESLIASERSAPTCARRAPTGPAGGSRGCARSRTGRALSTNAAPGPHERLRGRARRGARMRDHAPLRHKGTQTFVAGLRYDRPVAPWLLDGPMNRAAFDVWVETQLAPELGKGDVVMLDNLAVHRSPRAAEILRANGAWFLFLPPSRPTSTRSRWPSPSSRPICAASAPAPSTPSGAPSVKSAASSIETNAGTTSRRPATCQIKRMTLNGIIGGIQEYSAGQSTRALRNLESPHAPVLRDGVQREIDARELAPGDAVLLGRQPGAGRPAAPTAEGLRCDEALLTGESRPLAKEAGADGDAKTSAFAGTLVVRGRARGIVTATGAATKVGRIAEMIAGRSVSQPPLMIRMQRFSRSIALSVGVAVHCSSGSAFSADGSRHALPDGGRSGSQRNSRGSARSDLGGARGRHAAHGEAHVIVRNMPAIELLGSCTIIATAKPAP